VVGTPGISVNTTLPRDAKEGCSEFDLGVAAFELSQEEFQPFLQAQSLKRSGNVIPTCSILMCYGMTSEFMRGTTASRGSTKPWGHTC
jgi:hypothetical protein